jgi:hypothetical protein
MSLAISHYVAATGFADTTTFASLVAVVLDGFDNGLHFDRVETI